jgi:hypothetical protein
MAFSAANLKPLVRACSSLPGEPHRTQLSGGSGAITGGWSLALIGNASGQTFGAEGISIRGVFDKETRRKPLGFAADAWSYGV